MSSSTLLSGLPKIWSNVQCNSLNSKSLNLNNGSITNVSSINGQAIPSFVLDFNPVNIIYRPGGVLASGSNIVITWAAVLAKANQINVNQILNIYFDDSIISPCPIDVSHDFSGRANFLSINSNFSGSTQVQINDGILISNLSSISGTIQLNCQSLTGPNLAFNNYSNFYISNSAILSGSADATVASIQMNTLQLFISLNGYAGINLGSLQTSFIDLQHSFLEIDFIFSSYVQADLVSGDGTSTLLYSYDASSSASFSNSGYVGTATYTAIDTSTGVAYRDVLQAPAWSTSNVQSSLDYVKAHYLPQSSTDSMTCGSIACSSINVNSSQVVHGVLYGSFTDSSVIAPSTALEGAVHSVSNVQASPQSVLMSLTTPNGGSTGSWDFVIVSQNGNATSYNSGTKVLTLGYNLVNVGTIASTSTPVAVNYMIIY